jgi:uncharacterized protein YkwD
VAPARRSKVSNTSLAPRSGERGRGIVGVCLLVACASTSAPTPATTTTTTSTSTSAPASTSKGEKEGFAPGAGGAKSYAPTAAADGRRALPADALRRALLGEVRAAARKQGRPVPQSDPRLDWAMTDLARHVRGDELPALDVVDFLLGHYGLVEPSPHILLSSASSQGEAELATHARAEITEMLRTADIGRVGIGVDRAGDMIYVVLGLQEKRVELLAAIPRQIPLGGHVALEARIAAGFAKPEVVITAPDGTVRQQTPPLLKGVIRDVIRCIAAGRHQVEIAAAGTLGSSVLANFPVYCGVAPPAAAPRGAGVRTVSVTPEEAERQMLALINRDRQRAGVAPVKADDRLTAIARAHTRDMVEHDFVGHVSPTTGTAGDRVRRAGLTPTFISENVGRGYSAEEAEQGFMASPGHRANILDPRPQRVGIGIVFGAVVTGTAPLFVTQLFTN